MNKHSRNRACMRSHSHRVLELAESDDDLPLTARPNHQRLPTHRQGLAQAKLQTKQQPQAHTCDLRSKEESKRIGDFRKETNVRSRQQDHYLALPRLGTSFLSLPGELRNQIYALVIPNFRMLIISDRSNRGLAPHETSGADENKISRQLRYRLGHRLDKLQEEEGLRMTMDLLLACQEVRRDIELFLYSRTTFCFDSPKVLHTFLNRASKPGIRAITKLELCDQGYGNPLLTEHEKWRKKYGWCWHKMCERIGKEMTGLQHLEVTAYLQEWPHDYSKCTPNSSWKQALMQIVPPRHLISAKVHLHHHMLHRNTWLMEEISRQLEDEMMTSAGRDTRDRLETEKVLQQLAKDKAMKAQKKKAEIVEVSPGAARRALVISLQDIEKAKQTSGVLRPIVRRQNLDQYARINTVLEGPAEIFEFEGVYGPVRKLEP